LAKHFPDRARALPPEDLAALAKELAAFNTLSAGTLILGLDAFTQVVPPADAPGTTIAGDGAPLPPTGSAVLDAAAPPRPKTIRFAHAGDVPLYHQLVQSGFDREPPAGKEAHGLEVWREIQGADGKAVTQTSVTSKLDVVVWVRSTDPETRNVVLVDLLPGGF